MNIVEEKNEFFEKIHEAVKSGKEIYLYGAGEVGKLVYAQLRKKGIEIKGFCVDRMYYKDRPDFVGDVPSIFCLEDIVAQSAARLFVIAFRHDGILSVSQRYPKEGFLDMDFLDAFAVGEPLDYEFFQENRKAFEQVYNDFEDDKSRVVMDGFFNQKISAKMEYLTDLWENNQYYDPDIVPFERVESLVDCGAYDGDSYFSFRKNYFKNTGKEYAGSAYLLEPDSKNYQKLKVNCAEYRHCECLECGAWNKKDTLTFSMSDTSSGISAAGGISIAVDSIDNLMKGQKTDFIKMDIEGSELPALQGAENTIRTFHPVLAVCVYHKRDDLLTIPAYIRSVCPQYKFYLRTYNRYAQELVLYAVYPREESAKLQ